MAEIFAFLLVVIALAVVVPLAFPPKKTGELSITAMKALAKNHATGDTPVLGAIPTVPTSARKAKAPAPLFPWREVAVYLVSILQAGLAVGVLYFAYSVYQTTPTAEGSGGISSLSFFAQFWLGMMFLAAVIAFSTGIFTSLKHQRYVFVSAALQILMGGIFLMLGNWALPMSASLIVIALCAILVVREAKSAPAPTVRPKRLDANMGGTQRA